MSEFRPRILVVDDEPQMHRFLEPALRAAGYEPIRADTGRSALAEIARRPPDAVVLDLGLPDLDGQGVLTTARHYFQGPIIILSARDHEIEKIYALDAGADDYVEKPFRIGELLARLRAAMRRRARTEEIPPTIRAGDLVIDLRRRLVTRGGEAVRFSPREYNLLAKLASGGGRVMTHRELLAALWGPAHVEDTQYLRVFVSQLRQKIEVDPAAPRRIVTQAGVGYRFVADESTKD